MKSNRLSLSLLVLLMVGLFFTSFSNVRGSNDLDFTFENDILMDYPTMDYNTTLFNIGNETEFTEIYNASYSFTDDTNGAIPDGFTVNEAGGSVRVYSNINNHSKIVKMFDDGSDNELLLQRAIVQTSGTIEFYIFFAQTSHDSYIYIVEGSVTSAINLNWRADGTVQYYDTSWKNIDSYSSNRWYHISINFECGAEGYKGLSADTFNIYINGEKFGDYDFRGTAIEMDGVRFRSKGVISGTHYLDAFGEIWDSFYEEGDNIVPIMDITNITQIDKFEFSFTEDGVYSSTINPVPFFSEIHGSEYATNGYVYIYSDDINNKGIYKDDFVIENGIINVSINFDYNKMKVHNSYFYFEVYSYDTTLIVKLRLHGVGFAPNTITMLSYYDGSSYNNITEINEFNDYNLYINDMVVLTNNSVVLERFPMISNKKGLSEIKFIGSAGAYGDGVGQDWYDRIYINNIGAYVNGESLSIDYQSLTLETNLTWDSNEYNLFKSNITNFCSITATSDDSLSGSIVLYQDYNYSGEKVLNVWDMFTGGDEISGWYKLIDFYLTFTSNESFTIHSLEIEGIRLIESSNEYYLDFEYGNVDINNSYFYVDLNNRLQYNLFLDDNLTEYIQASFNINDVSSENRSVRFKTNIDGVGEGYFSVDYHSGGGSLMEFPYYQTTTNVILPQTELITKFTILVTDNDLYYNGLCAGYVSGIKLIYNPDLSITITTLNLLGIIVPLIIMIAPPLALNKKFGSGIILPMFILMSLVCVLTNLIPVWLFFIIAFSSIGFLMLKKKVEVAF